MLKINNVKVGFWIQDYSSLFPFLWRWMKGYLVICQKQSFIEEEEKRGKSQMSLYKVWKVTLRKRKLQEFFKKAKKN